MSRSADIDLTFGEPVSVASVLAALGPLGWGPVEPLGVSFLIDEEGDFDWERGDPSAADSIVATLDDEENSRSTLGLSLYNESFGCGGSLLFFAGRTQVAFTPTIDRRPLMDDAPYMTAIAWYLDQFIPPLVRIGLSGYQARDIVD